MRIYPLIRTLNVLPATFIVNNNVDTSFNHGLCCLNSKEYAVQRIEIHRACGEYKIHSDKAIHELLVPLVFG